LSTAKAHSSCSAPVPRSEAPGTTIDTRHTAAPPALLIACRECDLIQREVELPARGSARCARCSAVLYRNRPDAVNRALAYTTAAAVAFMLANVFPLVGMSLKGELVETTLFGTAAALYAGGMRTVAAVVFVTTFVAPLIELAAMACLLLPLRFSALPSAGPRMFRAMRMIQPWRMVEVMMLGVLVALVKLAHLAEIVLGVALWSLAALVILLAAATSAFEPRDLWARPEASP
jgi:paraquat-inducible protein A